MNWPFVSVLFLGLYIRTVSLIDLGNQPILLTLNGIWKVTNQNSSISVPGKAPGGIYTDLMSSGTITDPYFRYNDIKYKWIAMDNWNYSRSFPGFPASLMDKKRVMLVCHGLDTVSDIYLNGMLVGSTMNMFVRYNFDIKTMLKENINELVVSFKSAVEYAKKKHESHLSQYVVPPTCPPPVQKGECHVNFIRKAQSSFSWDWGPSFPNQGIWKDIEIVLFDSIFLTDVVTETTMKKLPNGTKTWQLNIKSYFDLALDSTQIKGFLHVYLNDKSVLSKRTTIVSTPGSKIGMLEFEIDNLTVEPWWPSGYGNQTLYNVTVEFLDQISQETTTKTVRTGFRTVELIQQPIRNATGLTFYFRINGLAIFAKGSNWIPADSFQERIQDSYVKELLQSARDANMNMLRVWGGGVYESEFFYRTADELGILLWHDLMFACALYPVDYDFLSSIKSEVQQQVRRLQHHPSILLWAGNNENEVAIVQGWWPQVFQNPNLYRNDYKKLYIDIIKPIVESEDTSRPYISSSPSNGKETEAEGWISADPQSELWGDVHFYDYIGDGWDWKTYPTPRFASEYGFQSYPSFETLKAVSFSSDWTFPVSQFLSHRQHSLSGGLEMEASVNRHMKLPNKSDKLQAFKDNLILTQITQAMSIKTETEHFRRTSSKVVNSKGKTMGALFWQLNDIWQAPSWAAIEYGGKWKMLQYFSKRFFAPVLVSPYVDNDVLRVNCISDELKSKRNMTLTVQVYKWNNMKPALTVTLRNMILLPQLSLEVFNAPLSEATGLLERASCDGSENCFLYIRLSDKTGKEVSNNFVFLTQLNRVKGLQKPTIQVSSILQMSDKVFKMRLTTTGIAPFVWLNVAGVSGEFDDNGFLLVESQKVVHYTARTPITLIELHTLITVTSLADIMEIDDLTSSSTNGTCCKDGL